MTPPVLEIEDLHVSFPQLEGTVRAVRGCSLTVEKGQAVGLVGESGSGKSLTAMACLGLLPGEADVSGSIFLNDQNITTMAERGLEAVRGRSAAMIFQNPGTALNPFFSIGRQMVDVIVCNRSGTEGDPRALASEALSAVHIPDPDAALEKYPHQMSGGQLQRVMIAMALACKPVLLIADEPTTALDVTIQAQIILLLRELADTRGLSILFITHDLGVVASLCDTVNVMYAGEIVESGSVEQILDHPMHPYTRMLLRTVPDVDAKTDSLEFIPGQVPDMMAPPSGCAFHPRCEMASERCRLEKPDMELYEGERLVACHHAGEPVLSNATVVSSDAGGITP